MYKTKTITKQVLVEHCDNCGLAYTDSTEINAWCSLSGRFGMAETSYNLHFHFCCDGCEEAFKVNHARLCP